MKRSTVCAVVLTLVVTASAGAQGTEGREGSDPGGTTQDQSFRVYEKPEELARLLESGSEPCLLLDVRSLAEYQKGHITSAVSMPLAELTEKGLSVPADTLIIVYCASGMRSAAAAQYLQGHGYTRVVNFGSIDRWPGEREKSP